MPFSSFFLDEEQPEVPEEKAESVPDQPLQEAWQGSAATWKEVIEGGYIFDSLMLVLLVVDVVVFIDGSISTELKTIL